MTTAAEGISLKCSGMNMFEWNGWRERVDESEEKKLTELSAISQLAVHSRQSELFFMS